MPESFCEGYAVEWIIGFYRGRQIFFSAGITKSMSSNVVKYTCMYEETTKNKRMTFAPFSKFRDSNFVMKKVKGCVIFFD